MKLDGVLESARAREGDAWTAERAERVYGGLQMKRERRVVRARLVRRGIIVASVAAFFGLVLLRGAGASTPAQAPAASIANSEVVAAHASNDGGYARD